MSEKQPGTLSARQAEHDPNFMLSLARGLEVLNAFSTQRQRLTISQLSQKTQISRAAVRRCLLRWDCVRWRYRCFPAAARW